MSTISRLEKHKADLSKLISQGDMLELAMSCECYPEYIPKYEENLKKEGKGDVDLKKILPNFTADYQSWYSEAKALIRQLFPDFEEREHFAGI
jgi:hypothetical protein